MRIGIFGGTFDPVHRGHLEVAEKVWRWFALDRLYFVPAAHSPHKAHPPEATAWDRFAMLVVATQEHPRFYVSPLELERPGVSYTVETVREFRRRVGEDAAFYLILGADAFQEITRWKEYEQIVEMTNLVVVSRPGHPLTAEHLPAPFRARVRLGASEYEEGSIPHIYLCSGLAHEVSATAIRAALRRGEAVDHLLPPGVAAYIAKYRLYHDENTI